jgi:ADP-heptose:LPS heptosyltransferase
LASPLQPIVIWFGRVGDMILLSTLLDILHRRYGAPCHLIGAGSFPQELYATHADVGCISSLHRYTAFLFDPAWWRTRARLRASGNAPVYVCEYDPKKLARIARLLRAAGVAPQRCLYITADPAFKAQRHWVDRLVSFGHLTPPALNAADYPWPTPPPRCAPLLQVDPRAAAECDAWIAAAGWRGRPLLLVQPGNRRTMRGKRLEVAPADDKAWPIERWAQLLRQLQQQLPQAVIILCGAPREALLLSWIVAATQLPQVVAAELPLPRLLALCVRAHSMISVDTGPAHAAAALGLPLVVLFGGHSQAEWLPRSPAGSPVIGIGGPPHSSRLDQIDVASVMAAWQQLPGRTPAADAPASPAELRTPAARASAP